MKNILAFMFIICMSVVTYSQTFVFFSDSPNNTYYDPSWGFTSGGSSLELINSSKFPVDAGHYYSGTNSLRLNWKSNSGGDWGLAVAESGWPGHDITDKDSIVMWVYSESDIQSSYLPLIYLEDLSNNKTNKKNLYEYVGDIKANVWTRVSYPLAPLKNAHGIADLKKIKTIYFGQSYPDGTQHTLYIDDLRMISKSVSVPSTPLNVNARGYQKHIDISWDLSVDSLVDGYKIYRLDDTAYKAIGTVSKNDRFYTDFIDSVGITKSYKVSAYNSGLVESPLSNIVSASTRDMSDDELLSMLQEATFRYFWDYGHPVSGLARERYNSGNTVTTGGSGFGIMALITGIERGFITRSQGIERMKKILSFLSSADKFHGAFPHWLDGSTGKVIPFSTYDNGGDLVETAFMMEGLLTARQYFNKNTDDEKSIYNSVTNLWEGVEWNWYRKDTTAYSLIWHWSPNYGWQINMQIQGWDEAMIVYLLAVASPTHSVPADCYKKGWCGAGYSNGRSFYGIPLYIGSDYGGPLFFAHYSFMGFDPRNIKDAYTNYFVQNKNHTLVNKAYCNVNPQMFPGYGPNTWGLTASDDPFGYSAHEPKNDNGTITPTAALSSIPYTPVESMAAFKELYNSYGKKIWGIYGFKDAFNVWKNWYADSYIAIDQGPIICMVENYRSGLLWKYFMANPEIQPMLDKIGFVKDINDVAVNTEVPNKYELMNNYPNPFNPSTTIKFSIMKEGRVTLRVYNILGKEISTLVNENKKQGSYFVTFNASKLSSGIYFYKLDTHGFSETKKMLLLK